MSTSRLSSAPSSTLRPRAPRLISGLSEIDDSTFNRPASRSSSKARADSPEHNRQASRASSLLGQRNTDVTGRPRPTANGKLHGKGTASATSNFWGSSWSALQDLASDFLGEQETNPQQRRPGKQSGVRAGKLFAPAAQTSWGLKPSAADYIATGSQEEREAKVRTQKRKDLLSGAAASYPDSLGKFKRRMSDEGNSTSTPPGAGEDREALVYLHTVIKGDTLAGITIRYNCSANVLRRANRMWANDTVQSRRVILLPVDACGARGSRLTEHEADLMIDSSKAVEDSTGVVTPTAATGSTNGVGEHHRAESTASTLSAKPPSSILSTTTAEEPAWTHDSWTMLPNHEKPTEIVRLPRQALGYFPPARRKSLTYSDRSTPSVSLDLNRQAYFDSIAGSDAANNSSAIADGVSPYRPDVIDQQRPRRGRLLSNATNGYFPSYLTGPGGVGTMNKNVRCPGPAQDGLNKLFASHLPDVAPPAHQQRLYMPDVPLYTDDPAEGRGVSPFGRAQSGVLAGALTPASSNPSVDLQQVGAAVEGWIRKFAAGAKNVLESGGNGGNSGRPSPALSAARGAAGATSGGPSASMGPSGIGDLIEMADSFEIGGDDEDDAGLGGARGIGSGHGAMVGVKGRAKSGIKSGKAD